MTNKLVVIVNSLKVPKIKKILLYKMKFLVPNYSCPQIPVLSVLCPKFNLLNPPRTKFLGTPLLVAAYWWLINWKWRRRQLSRSNFKYCLKIHWRDLRKPQRTPVKINGLVAETWSRDLDFHSTATFGLQQCRAEMANIFEGACPNCQ